jgi:hypothetical protein
MTASFLQASPLLRDLGRRQVGPQTFIFSSFRRSSGDRLAARYSPPPPLSFLSPRVMFGKLMNIASSKVSMTRKIDGTPLGAIFGRLSLPALDADAAAQLIKPKNLSSPGRVCCAKAHALNPSGALLDADLLGRAGRHPDVPRHPAAQPRSLK